MKNNVEVLIYIGTKMKLCKTNLMSIPVRLIMTKYGMFDYNEKLAEIQISQKSLIKIFTGIVNSQYNVGLHK